MLGGGRLRRRGCSYWGKGLGEILGEVVETMEGLPHSVTERELSGILQTLVDEFCSSSLFLLGLVSLSTVASA